MKITAVKPYAVRVGRPRALYVKVETDEGVTGLGESGLWGRELAVAECVGPPSGCSSARTRVGSTTSGR